MKKISSTTNCIKLISLIAVFLAKCECYVNIRDIQATPLGGTVVIYCDLTNEVLNNLIWRRSDYNGTNILNILPTNIPRRYTLQSIQTNYSYALSTLTINGVQEDDFAVFECSSGNYDKKNLTELITTTSTTTTTTPSTPDPSMLCFNGSYNSALYALLITSVIILIFLLYGFVQLVSKRTYIDLMISFICISGSIGFMILMIVFWINPNYVSIGPSGSYSAPLIIIPSLILSFSLLWIGILYFLFKSYYSDNLVKFADLIVIGSIGLCQIILLLLILCSVIYCAGYSFFRPIFLNYSVLNDICASIIASTCIIFAIYFFWIFKDKLARMEIKIDVEKDKTMNGQNDIDMIRKKLKLNAKESLKKFDISLVSSPIKIMDHSGYNYNLNSNSQSRTDSRYHFMAIKTSDENIMDQTIGSSNVIDDLNLNNKKKKTKKLIKPNNKKKITNDTDIINEADVRSLSLNSNEQKIKF